MLICLALIFAGGLVVGFATTASLAFIRVFEFIGAVGIPLSGAVFLAWFAYKLLLEPVARKRKLERLREYRARRASTHESAADEHE